MSATALDVDHLLPWLDAVRAACAAWGEDVATLSAICLRESGAGWAPGYSPQGKADGWGDHGFGFGLFQIDRRYHRAFTDSGTRGDPELQARQACRILHEAREWLRSRAASLSIDELERATIAAYNAGPGAVYHWVIVGGDPDRATTGGDYSRWVINRASELRMMRPDLFVPQVKEVA